MYECKMIGKLFLLVAVLKLTAGEKPRASYVKTAVSQARDSGLLYCPGIYHTIPGGFEDLTKKVLKSTGTMITECEDKQYLLLKSKVKVNEIWSTCSRFGMIPASIESMAEIRCISDNYWKKSDQDKKAKDYNEMYWTAHVDINTDSKFISCVTGRLISSDAWNSEEPNNEGGKEACGALHLGQYYGIGMFDNACDTQNKVICEYGRDAKLLVKDLKVENLDLSCPSAQVQVSPAISQQQPKEFYSSSVYDKLKDQGIIKCPAIFSNFTQNYEKYKDSTYKEVSKSTSIVIGDCPDKKYILTKYTVSLSDIWTECGQYGMVPAVIESKDELQCINSAYSKYLKKSGGDHMYLTSILDLNINRSFTSCVTSGDLQLDLWAMSQPDNVNKDEACVALQLGVISGFHDVTCDEPQLKLICESGKNAKLLLSAQAQKLRDETSAMCMQKSVGADKFKLIRSQCKIKTLKESSFNKIMQGLQTIVKTLKLKIRI